VEIFTSMREAEVVGGDWREAYNKSRPHSALGYLTPAAFAATQQLPKTTGGEAAPASRQAPPLRSNLGKNQNPETLIAGGT
jgi:hypothetical protein